VAQWYQKRFLPNGVTAFNYLDLTPNTLESATGFKYQPRALRRFMVPAKCFYRGYLYTLRFGTETTDDMERFFFGAIDQSGCRAVEHFAEYRGLMAGRAAGTPDAFQDLIRYMGAQRFRSPRGLDDLRKRATYVAKSPNAVLTTLASSFDAFARMWTEGVWEIVRATQTHTKFLLTDGPVAFYNKIVFPSEWQYPNDVSLKGVGTRTIFPLGLDSCLILTHLEFARHPRMIFPAAPRSKARFYDQTLKHLGDIQYGRELEEDEVLRINYILKKRATRYIAAAEEEWLYPEDHVSTTEWKLLDDDWFLLRNLWRVTFTTGIIMGNDTSSFAMDEYGHKPWQRGYQDKRRRAEERAKFDAAKHDWAKKSAGKSRARHDRMGGLDIEDELIDEYLAEEGVLVEGTG
jgi:hypothetical protein